MLGNAVILQHFPADQRWLLFRAWASLMFAVAGPTFCWQSEHMLPGSFCMPTPRRCNPGAVWREGGLHLVAATSIHLWSVAVAESFMLATAPASVIGHMLCERYQQSGIERIRIRERSNLL